MKNPAFLGLFPALILGVPLLAQVPSSTALPQTRAQGTFNIVDFGAVGDGQSDCTRAMAVAQPSSRADSIWMGAGEGLSLEVLTNSLTEKAVRFPLGRGSATYRVRAGDALPVVTSYEQGRRQAAAMVTGGTGPICRISGPFAAGRRWPSTRDRSP